MIGQLLDGRYKIRESLAAGGFGQTFLAEDIKQFNKVCVVKQLKPSFTNPEALQVARRLFESEAQLLNRLGDHDQIPHLLAYFEENQEFFLVQDFVEGHSLEKEIIVGKKQSEAYGIALLESVLEPLAFIHGQKVIHRDIKPANLIRRQQDGKVVLIDFGAVKELAATQVNAQGKTQMGTIIGTPGYMSSEQGRGKPKLSSDVYAIGMIIVQALTGKIPPMGYNTNDELYEDPNTAEIMWRQDAEVSPQFAAILDRMICYDFRQRYRSALEVKQAIAALSSQSSHLAPTALNSNHQTVLQDSIPETALNIPQPQVHLAKSPQAPIAAPKKHWARVAFRGFQRFVGISFLIMGLPISIYATFEMNNMSVPQEERENAMAALIIFGLPFTASGGWMLYSLHRRVRKEKFDSDWLRQNFYHAIEANQGEISILKFAQTSKLSGKESQRYLEARVKEFNGDVQRSPDGETIYRFKL
ncbi:serine/threonine-protein kinase [[Limnothrix rosea] IAM M-220]|uniref:serine/threonine-protein kinase n=1 Tax=[Limnothrix rosea] IAM M-220 TaxID=454133 RepID=UPI000960DDAD|nr:serine/threonine-protein kinase [[Limnothrix rosea] IAM M-220]OKH17886.1 serine/threonine protein kinase [[Limnothrix rosea] IAM M-220]